MFTIGVSPLAHASYSGPVASAPAATRARTIASWLPRTARPSGVVPSCSAHTNASATASINQPSSHETISTPLYKLHTRHTTLHSTHTQAQHKHQTPHSALPRLPPSPFKSTKHYCPPSNYHNKRMPHTVHVGAGSGSLRAPPSEASRSLRLHASTRPAAESSRPARHSHRHYSTAQHTCIQHSCTAHVHATDKHAHETHADAGLTCPRLSSTNTHSHHRHLSRV